MAQPDHTKRTRHRRGWVPYNPGLQEWVEGKNQWQHGPDAPPLPSGSKRWNQRGYLPHRDEPGLKQFVTFRLADCFPAELRSEWEGLLKVEDHRSRVRQLEEYLDKGRGECHLKRPVLASLVEGALRFFHGARYELEAWVVMPNHVHVLFTQKAEPLGRVVGSWKSFTAKEAKRPVLG